MCYVRLALREVAAGYHGWCEDCWAGFRGPEEDRDSPAECYGGRFESEVYEAMYRVFGPPRYGPLDPRLDPSFADNFRMIPEEYRAKAESTGQAEGDPAAPGG